ncbi:MAG: AMP-binding protein [Saprospiraceae bacterium]
MSEERPWLKNYPKGVPANIDAEKFLNVVEMLEGCFKKYNDLVAFSNMGKDLTYGQLDTLSKQFGAYLIYRGLQPGDKIALMMPNLLQYPIALFGALRAGIIVVNTNPLYTPREMKHQFTDAGVKAIVIAENYAANLEKIIDTTSIKTVIVTPLGEMLGAVKGLVTNLVVKYVKKMIPKYDLKNIVSFKQALSEGKTQELDVHYGQPNDTILIQYTGGTTGVAKGAELTNRNLVSNMQQVGGFLFQFLEEGKEVALSPLPMYHIFAFTVHALALLSVGTKNVLVTNPRDLPSVIKEFNKKEPITLMTGVNTLFNALTSHPDFATANFASLKFAVGGGMAVQRPVAERFEKVTGAKLIEGYGMTESSPVASCNPIDGTDKIGSIGMPLPSTELRIIDEDGNVLAQGQVGEIQIKGPQVMKGYYNRPEATAETIKNGWLCTGDIGQMDENGFFKIVDRKKDMILVSGFNVYPNEIEEVLASHPKISEVAAIGVPDPKSTEAVKVFIVKSDKSLTKEEVKAFCAENMTGYKKPKHIAFREELPKTNVGKILRRALKEEEAKK